MTTNEKTKEELLNEATPIYTTADAMIDTLVDAGVDCIFANIGSDHPAIVESWAKADVQGRTLPKIIICPHEMVALSAAHGYAQVTGRPQAVFVHVDVGTQNMGGAIHNATRGRIPVFIFSGASPVTQEGELRGGRNEFIHYLQDVPDQRAIVRQYTKWDYDVHTGKNIQKLTLRAMQIAQSEPKGPVYMMSPREMLEEEVPRMKVDKEKFAPLAPSALNEEKVKELASTLSQAKNPLIVTSYLGRNVKAVEELVKLAEQLALPVMEAGPNYMNFPANHPMHLGYEGYFGVNEYLKQADVVLVIDSDIPWLPLNVKPKEDAKVFWIDVDPLKDKIPFWYYEAEQPMRADSYVALKQLNDYLEQVVFKQTKEITERYGRLSKEHDRIRAEFAEKEKIKVADGYITPQFLTATLRDLLDDDTIIMNETISNYSVVWNHILRDKPGTLFGSGASSLGWHGGASIGAKLANPDKTVVALTGDGSYLFSVPASVHFVSKKYNAPFLTVIYNNRGWHSPKLSTLGVHPEGLAKQQDLFYVNFGDDMQLEKIAEATGQAYAKRVEKPEELRNVLEEALQAVKNGRSAVVNVAIKPISNQNLGE
ncbi:thiamine pyrophosphate-requiring protein (plasmid) [Aneurinibacillus sp. Ricciae_BoGa-3]|uniref:thiamine pyrophosphate-requiring protein n=1 Tax=Aneurinibacillus sp. Ricciae_BoGa-3 TaxID=3022697 RepID=UPI0023415E25|nr:thiamine pyrophosphate-requiring protein [Aneurinibacillus sp. Ricciae_BoGa-3]WCK57302.1 thiamine pyrophosphate-requiring protein [Aneurinibacillus sp. Ricciae_BoGa-3]